MPSTALPDWRKMSRSASRWWPYMFGLVWLIALASLVLLWLLAPVVQARLPVETRLAGALGALRPAV